MAHVVFGPGLRRFTDGAESVDVEARDVRDLLRVLVARWPALEARLAEGTAIALDGEVIPNGEALLERLSPDTEVHFLPQIGGG